MVLTALTLGGLLLVMSLFGEDGPRQAQRDAIAEQQIAEEPAPEPEPEPAVTEAEPATDAPAEAVPAAAAQTPQRVQDFPGPALRPSPEHAGETESAIAELAPTDGAAIMYVTGSRVNFRAGPSTGDSVIGALNGGSPVEALGEVSGWVNIRDAQGRTGYMSAQFLSPDRPN